MQQLLLALPSSPPCWLAGLLRTILTILALARIPLVLSKSAWLAGSPAVAYPSQRSTTILQGCPSRSEALGGLITQQNHTPSLCIDFVNYTTERLSWTIWKPTLVVHDDPIASP